MHEECIARDDLDGITNWHLVISLGATLLTLLSIALLCLCLVIRWKHSDEGSIRAGRVSTNLIFEGSEQDVKLYPLQLGTMRSIFSLIPQVPRTA
jgi:hypothetical protein